MEGVQRANACVQGGGWGRLLLAISCAWCTHASACHAAFSGTRVAYARRARCCRGGSASVGGGVVVVGVVAYGGAGAAGARRGNSAAAQWCRYGSVLSQLRVA